MVAPFSKFYDKIWVGFCLNTGKDNRKSISSFFLKNGTIGFQNKPLFERSACFYVTITGNFERFRYFQFKTDFLENENFFQKTGVLFF